MSSGCLAAVDMAMTAIPPDTARVCAAARDDLPSSRVSVTRVLLSFQWSLVVPMVLTFMASDSSRPSNERRRYTRVRMLPETHTVPRRAEKGGGSNARCHHMKLQTFGPIYGCPVECPTPAVGAELLRSYPGGGAAPPDRAVAQRLFEQAERLQVLGGAPGDAPLRSRHRVEREQHDRGAAQGERPAAQGPVRAGGPRGRDRPAACYSARRFDADRRDNPLIFHDSRGSNFRAE